VLKVRARFFLAWNTSRFRHRPSTVLFDQHPPDQEAAGTCEKHGWRSAGVRPSSRGTASKQLGSFSFRCDVDAGEGVHRSSSHRRALGPGPGARKARFALTPPESFCDLRSRKGQRSNPLQALAHRPRVAWPGGCAGAVHYAIAAPFIHHVCPHSPEVPKSTPSILGHVGDGLAAARACRQRAGH